MSEAIALGDTGDLRSYLMMMGAAELIRDLKWDQADAWDSSQEFFRNTNIDVVTAEGLTWIEAVLFPG